jgi:glycosyltransferase involved in cell wall biosynthesis
MDFELAKKPKICLLMIVKNEAKTLPTLLPSVVPLISSWLIIDTGSTEPFFTSRKDT